MSGVREYDREALMPEILERLSNGEPLAQICRDEHMPVRAQVYNWLQEDMAFEAAFRKARDDGFDAIAADCLAIADDGRRDYVDDGDGGVAVNHDHIQRAKLRVDTRLKLLAKWDPRRYGDRVMQEHTGPNGGPIETVTSFKLAPLE